MQQLPRKLPSERDFDPFGGCLDAQCAWKHFGGLNLDEAYSLFCENPLHYQEDFMFMGHKAFVYYFPVIDRFIRNGDDDQEASIIGLDIAFQVTHEDITKFASIKNDMIELSKFVLNNLDRFGETKSKPNKLASTWKNLLVKLTD